MDRTELVLIAQTDGVCQKRDSACVNSQMAVETSFESGMNDVPDLLNIWLYIIMLIRQNVQTARD